MNPLSVSLLITRVRCSIPISVALSSMGDKPMPSSFRGICTPSVGKLGRKPRACLIALLRIPCMVVSYLSLNNPRCVAWYLDFSSCSMTIDLRRGLRLRFAKTLTSFSYVFSDMEEVFSKIWHGIDVDS